MHSSRLVIRQCRASSAYNISHALTSTFSTSTRRAQDEAAQQTRSGAVKGTFADYEAISEQLQRDRGADGQPEARRAGAKGPPKSAGLHVRQAMLEQEMEQKPGKTWRPTVPSTPAAVREGPVRPTNRAHARNKAPKPVENRPRHVATVSPSLDKAPEEASEQPGATTGKVRLVAVTKPPNADIWATVNHERQGAVFKAMRTQGGEKYVMQAIGKWVNTFSSDRDTTFDWSDIEGVERMRIILDYHPRHIEPMDSPMKTQIPQPWALGRQAVRDKSATDLLDEEIQRFVAWAAPEPAEIAARHAVAQKAQDFIRTHLGKRMPGLQTELFGSEATGLSLTASDLDIRLDDPDVSGSWSRRSHIMGREMRLLTNQMGRSADYADVCMRWSKFPIINAKHRATGINIQIVSSPSTTNQAAVVAKYLAELPHLRDLFYIMRTALGMRDLIDVFNGGVGSYGLFNMLVAALKRGERSSALPQTAAGQLLYVLDFWVNFPFDTHGLTIEPSPKLFKKHPLSSMAPGVRQSHIHAAARRGENARAGQWAIGVVRPLQPYLLCLQDPADPTNDLGRKSNAIKNLQASFRYVLFGMRKMLDLAETGKRTQWLSDAVLDVAVGRCHEVMLGRRRKVEEWGRGRVELEEKKAAEGVDTEQSMGAERARLDELRDPERRELEELRREEGGMLEEPTGAERADLEASREVEEREMTEEGAKLEESTPAERARLDELREAERRELEELRREEAAMGTSEEARDEAAPVAVAASS
ncbi:hypothetical protein LTR57_007299 [Friedmanniomyces endolithicus]|uniref:Poly(A) RNA polymerase mitochondrial-like central palm domain-containing protein n=1 Tax=Friedmanniomyces endolithicus TaxID=329885 RepID=A0A4U0V9M7_9PEZI|nr:hypothetical protein LTR57_007299 [Friedmanniomyces endolithicus]KAK1011339.1 hypothetical protein LTS01_001195 [Friedmanniomyces endolithicus]TKA45537.1 hypothetical protein B0A54_04076 [Friedmanniomyces endolithicus]